MQGRAVGKPQGANDANDAQGASAATDATAHQQPDLSLNEINFKLTRHRGILKEMKEMKLPQASVDELQKIIDELELKKQGLVIQFQLID